MEKWIYTFDKKSDDPNITNRQKDIYTYRVESLLNIYLYRASS